MLNPSTHGARTAYGNVVTLNVSGSETDYDILTEAVAAGFNNAVPGTINLNILSGANVTGSGTSAPAITTGAVNGSSTINIVQTGGDVQGWFGTVGYPGATGSDGFSANCVSGCITNITATGTSFGGGGGGAGGMGVRQTWTEVSKGEFACDGTNQNGSNGSQGALGAAGTGGSYGGGTADCVVVSPGSGGPAGYAVRKNGHTVNTSGTFSGTVG